MGMGIVTAKAALLREVPAGTGLGRLAQGTVIEVRGGPGAWAEVVVEGREGVLSRRSFALQAADMPSSRRAVMRSLAIPPAAGPADIRLSGNSVTGPQGVAFGKRHRLGLYNYGQTALDRFFDEDPQAFPGLSASIQRVMRAVAVNEGKLEAINTWDNAILSCSVYQWTVSADSGEGELPFALSVLKARAPDSFAAYFGSLGLDVAVRAPKAFAVGRGYFLLNGRRLDTGAAKAPLRDPLWAYRFWRAAHDREVRRAYVRVAIDRIAVFYGPPAAALDNRPLSDFITSEEAVAQLLDQHVNRPGHVPRIIAQAIRDLQARPGKSNPATWGDAEEHAVLARYLALRATSSMTDSSARARRISAAVTAGTLSGRRGSFRPAASP